MPEKGNMKARAYDLKETKKGLYLRPFLIGILFIFSLKNKQILFLEHLFQ